MVFYVDFCDHAYEFCYCIWQDLMQTASGWWVILVKYVLKKEIFTISKMVNFEWISNNAVIRKSYDLNLVASA